MSRIFRHLVRGPKHSTAQYQEDGSGSRVEQRTQYCVAVSSGGQKDRDVYAIDSKERTYVLINIGTSLHMKTLVYSFWVAGEIQTWSMFWFWNTFFGVCPREKEKELAAYIYSVNYNVSRILTPLGRNTCPNCDIYNRSNDQMKCSQSKWQRRWWYMHSVPEEVIINVKTEST